MGWVRKVVRGCGSSAGRDKNTGAAIHQRLIECYTPVASLRAAQAALGGAEQDLQLRLQHRDQAQWLAGQPQAFWVHACTHFAAEGFHSLAVLPDSREGRGFRSGDGVVMGHLHAAARAVGQALQCSVVPGGDIRVGDYAVGVSESQGLMGSLVLVNWGTLRDARIWRAAHQGRGNLARVGVDDLVLLGMSEPGPKQTPSPAHGPPTPAERPPPDS